MAFLVQLYELFVFLCFGILVARFVYLQVFKYDELSQQAQSNRTAQVPIEPARGPLVTPWWRLIGNAEHHDADTPLLARPAPPRGEGYASPAAGLPSRPEAIAEEAEAVARRLGPRVDWPLD